MATKLDQLMEQDIHLLERIERIERQLKKKPGLISRIIQTVVGRVLTVAALGGLGILAWNTEIIW